MAASNIMATLQFRGTDFRGLIETLAEAVKLAGAGERPAIEVNGMIYRPGDLGAIAALMPQASLSARHQAIIDMMVTDKPRPADYRRAAASLARRADDSS
jgi:hypothetical protein